MGLLASGQTMLAGVMTAEGQSITYRRGVIVKAMIAMPDEQIEYDQTKDGLIIEVSARVFAINVADLEELALPEKADQINWGALAFQVLPSATSSRCFEWLDNHKSRIAIHTKQVKT